MDIVTLISNAKSSYSKSNTGSVRTSAVVVVFVLFLACQSLYLGSKEGKKVSQAIATADTSGTTQGRSVYPSWDLIPVEYSWIGKRGWVPPPGVPHYNSEAVRQTWERYNVLWTGDSTCRQDWATMWAIMYEPAPGQDGPAIPNEDVSNRDLGREININKGRRTEFCKRRDFQTNASMYHFVAPDGNMLCRNTNSSTKFDLAGGPCVHDCGFVEDVELQRRFRTNKPIHTTTKISDEYDAVIVQVGIWEADKERDCQRHSNISKHERLVQSLSRLKRSASPALKILYKNAGPSGHGGQSTTKLIRMNGWIREWFEKENPQHMYLLDYYKQIEPRSAGDARLAGDLPPHWDTEARTLSANILTHALNSVF